MEFLIANRRHVVAVDNPLSELQLI